MQSIKKNFAETTTEYLMLVVLFSHNATRRDAQHKNAPTTNLSHSQEKNVAVLPYQRNALKSFTQSHIVPKHRIWKHY